MHQWFHAAMAVLLVVGAFTGVALPLAQAAAESPAPTTLVGTVIFVCVSAVTGFGWMVRHVLTVTIPSLTKTFETEMKECRVRNDTTRDSDNVRHEVHRQNVLDRLEQNTTMIRDLTVQVTRLISELQDGQTVTAFRRTPNGPDTGG